ncbi:MAG: beta-ketoacyl-ACP synthase III [Phycisphaerae bacterium]
MKVISPVCIKGTGSYVPADVLTNDHFAAYLDTSDQWITQRTGIKTRHKAGKEESTSTFAVEAGRRAIEDAGLTPGDIGLVLLATSTPDYPIPMTAGLVQHALGIKDAPAFDLNATCSGMVYGMVIAANMLESGAYDNVLLIGADTLTRFTDYEDRSTCILFGDGGGAAVLSRSADPDRGMVYRHLGADGQYLKCLWVPAGGSREPSAVRTVNERLHYMRMSGRELFKIAVGKMQSLIDDALRQTGLTADDLALVVPHQSNFRIIESVRSRLGLPSEKVAVNIDRYGNTSSASIGLALDIARRDGRVKDGDPVLFVAFGAGVSWGCVIMRI